MTPFQAAVAANVYYETAQKWKTVYNRNLEKNILVKKKKQIAHQMDLKVS
jgi:hypothetical protein